MSYNVEAYITVADKYIKIFDWILCFTNTKWLFNWAKNRYWIYALLQDAFYLSVLIGFRLIFSVSLFVIIFCRFINKFLLFIIRFFWFNIRIFRYVNRNCGFIIVNLLCVNRFCRLNNVNCGLIIWFSLFVIVILPSVIINLWLLIIILLYLIIKNRKNNTKWR